MEVRDSSISPEVEGLTYAPAVRVIQQEIVKYDVLVKAFIQDIRDCTGPKESINVLNVHVGKNMKLLKEAIDKLERLASDQNKQENYHHLLSEVESSRQQYASNQTALRKANLTCQLAINKQNRKDLFTVNQSPGVRHRSVAGKESLTQTAAGITDSLLSLNRMMSSQVQQSEETLKTLVSSSETISETQEEFKSMGSAIQQSSKLLSKYGRRECTDKVLIIVAFAFFFLSVFYVIRERLF